MLPFDSLYAHGFARVAVGLPAVTVADPARNADATIDLLRQAHDRNAAIAVFPELGLSGYTNQDLFHQQALTDAALDALAAVAEATLELRPVTVVGLPLWVGHQLFNTAAVLHRGRVLGVVPKSYLPNYREFYEKRHFSAARQAAVDTVRVLGEDVPFGADLLFSATDVDHLVIHAEICEDVWVPVPPSTWAALAGATVLCNLSASNVTIGKAGYRHELCSSQSARTIAAYVYANCGEYESTTDLAWDGHALVYENGSLLAESERFAPPGQLITADIDLDRLVTDRMRMTSYADSMEDHADRLREVRRVPFELGPPTEAVALERKVGRFPYVPSDPSARDERCAEVYNIQVNALTTRLRDTGIHRVVIGVSGGLDSTQALLVAARSMDDLGLPRANVLAYTLPGFATSDHTLDNARRLMGALGVSAHEIDIRAASVQMLHDIGHPAADGEAVYDRSYENVQAGARTSLLFRLANHHDALVLGTGDLSELALGWCTYGVGDHMSHYGINASVPKTLIQYLIRWVIETSQYGPEADDVLASILDTEISPELVPGDGDTPHQRSEDVVGPYELQDFHLYHVLRFGYRPSKVAFLAHHAWGEAYDLDTILRWLRVFVYRFFRISQFKRSALPDGPKVGSGGSVSPRGDWRAPSDGSAAPWLAEVDRLITERSRS
ncbi:MAG: NAD(+) synthase [Acidimicrobiales bacterium]|nr:NAD(+) synthase [Acidimicrobiales bacterium]